MSEIHWVYGGRNDLNDQFFYHYVDQRHRIKKVVRSGKLFSLKKSPAFIPQYTRQRIGKLLFMNYTMGKELCVCYDIEGALKIIHGGRRRESPKEVVCEICHQIHRIEVYQSDVPCDEVL